MGGAEEEGLSHPMDFARSLAERYAAIAIFFRMNDLLRSRVAQGPEHRFWAWFTTAEAALFAAESADEPIADSLGAELARVHPSLAFEFGPVEHDRREFIISADGDHAAFATVLSLARAAPPLPRWTIIPFRPARPEHFSIRTEDLTVHTHEVLFLARANGEHTDVTLALPGFRDALADAYEQVAYLILDTMLGEYGVVKSLGSIALVSVDDRPAGKWQPIIDIARVVKVAQPPIQ